MDWAADESFAKRNWHWILVAAIVGYFTLDYARLAGWFVRTPGEKDARLVGRWSGKSKEGGDGFRFLADGAGEYYSPTSDSTRHFAWGVEGGKLVAKVMMTDYWGLARYTYSLSQDGKRLRLEPAERRFAYHFPTVMNREP